MLTAYDVEQTKYNNSHTAVDIFFCLSLNQQQSNEMFSLFLDETMTYSCAIFKVGIAAFHLGASISIFIDFNLFLDSSPVTLLTFASLKMKT